VSLIEDYEFELLGVPELPEMTGNLGIRWFHLPIVDLDIPCRGECLRTEELRQPLENK